jgi:nitrogen-specific signal transduction histidine kinase/CheY-like chemotaxis protein
LIDAIWKIVEQKTHEHELEEAKTIAENANKSKDQFLANMSHELRTPLNAILGFSKLLSYQKNITDLQKSQITTMYKSGEHLLSLINDILDMSKIEAQGLELELVETNLIETIDTIFNINKVKADEKDLEFVIHKSKTIPQFVLADNRKLKQIMLNLINNAIKFTSDGKIIIRADYDLTQKTFIFEVEDTGRGIPEDMQIQIFEPFIQHTGKHLFAEGTGLGLTITKNIIEMMNGNITLESKPDVGSKFTVQIPLVIVKEKEFKIYEVEKIVTSYKGEKKKILVVDDNNANLLFLVDLLESVEFIVETAENGKIALQKMPIFKPDLVLLDYRMPIMNGLEFMVELKKDEIFKNTKVIGVSATVRQKEIKNNFVKPATIFLENQLIQIYCFKKWQIFQKLNGNMKNSKTKQNKKKKLYFLKMKF